MLEEAVRKYGLGNPVLWMDKFIQSKGLNERDRIMHELRVYVNMFQYAGEYDQLNTPSLLCFEECARRVQSIIHAYRSGQANWASTEFFETTSGIDYGVDPMLRQYVAKSAKEEVDIESVMRRNAGWE
jgi:hypothetical protein